MNQAFLAGVLVTIIFEMIGLMSFYAVKKILSDYIKNEIKESKNKKK